MFGGDDVNAIVIDIGSSTVKAGYAGEDAPKAVYPSSVGQLPSSSLSKSSKKSSSAGDGGGDGGGEKRTLLAGSDALGFRRDDMEVVPAFGPDGTYADWDAVEALWDHAVTDRLRLDASEHPFLLAEPTAQPDRDREEVVERVFEGRGPPALFLARDAVLSAFATGRATAMVVDAGHDSTTVAAVHEGYLLSKTVTRTPLAGAALTRAMLHVLEQKAGGSEKVAPSFSFKRAETSPGEFKVTRLSQPKTTSSFREFHRLALASDAKEVLCRAAAEAEGGGFFDVDANASMPTVTYELPDGTELEVGADRFGVPELLFDPSEAALKRYGIEASSLASSVSSSSGRPSTAGGGAAAGGAAAGGAGAGAAAGAAGAADASGAPAATSTSSSSSVLSLPNAVRASIAACDTDLKRDFYANVVLSGGTALLPGLRERLERDLAARAATQVALAATSKVKVTSPANAVERRFSVWIGGSILASLGSFQQMWMSKAEYEEHGKALIHRRAP